MRIEFPETVWSQIRKHRFERTKTARTLFDNYKEPVYRFILARGFSAEDAEDLTQEVFAQVTQDTFLDKADKKKGKFRTLLLATTKHVIADFLKREKAQKRGGNRAVLHIESIVEDKSGHFDVADDRSLTDEFTQQWVQNLMEGALCELRQISARANIPYYECLRLREFDKLSYDEIAHRTNATLSNVKNWIHHGKEHLRQILEKMIRQYCSSEEEYREEIATLLKS